MFTRILQFVQYWNCSIVPPLTCKNFEAWDVTYHKVHRMVYVCTHKVTRCATATNSQNIVSTPVYQIPIFSLSVFQPINPNLYCPNSTRCVDCLEFGHPAVEVIYIKRLHGSSSSSCQVTRSPWLVMKLVPNFFFLPPPCWHFIFLAQVSFIPSQVLWVHIYNCSTVSRKHMGCYSLPASSSFKSSVWYKVGVWYRRGI